jgi:hypothetical protein
MTSRFITGALALTLATLPAVSLIISPALAQSGSTYGTPVQPQGNNDTYDNSSGVKPEGNRETGVQSPASQGNPGSTKGFQNNMTQEKQVKMEEKRKNRSNQPITPPSQGNTGIPDETKRALPGGNDAAPLGQ